MTSTASSDELALRRMAVPATATGEQPGYANVRRAAEQLLGPPTKIRREGGLDDAPLLRSMHVLLVGPREEGYPVALQTGCPALESPFSMKLDLPPDATREACDRAVYVEMRRSSAGQLGGA